MPIRWAVIAAIACSALACAPKEQVVERVAWQPDPDTTWIGRTEQQVTDAFGPPTHKRRDGEGGLTLIYERVTSEMIVDDTLAAVGSEPGTTIQTPALVHGRVTPQTEEIASFWIGPNGTVQRYWIDPKHPPEKRPPTN